ncbi:SDR family NAD(P)-dependent oxidoreductase [Nocardioides sp. BP30]|uniref:SDR family NAD(P)-dependent oxidoreductase n=1 Tax=Nocardioides sp. BP30 TaxID=3036374 RepID=UPI0024695DC2|nr:SDR family oxidoreductase [Nocardioides sp. BP30]WGL53014.1 SDR family NAD(P)-dependent oxidoreductase [Nocardioides sp. BP30]
MTLADRVALVTGSGSGLGRATARLLAREGAHVLVADIDEASAQRTVEEVTGDAGSAETVRLDVSDRAAVDAVVADAFERYGDRFDLLVNNAGTDRGSDVVDIEDEQWHGVFGVNLHGPMYLSRAFVRGRLGYPGLADIACVVSISALTVGAGAGAYNSSKAALLKFTEVLQTEARERSWPVRVSAINPAAMATPMMDQWGLPPERMMDPEIVAGLIRTAVTLPPEAVLQSAVITLRNETYPR